MTEPGISAGIAETALDMRATKIKTTVLAPTITSLGAVLSQVNLVDPLTSAVSVPTPESYKSQLRDTLKQRTADKPSTTLEHGHGKIDERQGYVKLTVSATPEHLQYGIILVFTRRFFPHRKWSTCVR